MKKTQAMLDIRNKTEGELQSLLKEEREKLAQTKLKVKAGQEQNISLLKKSRVAIAHILTAMKGLASDGADSVKDA